MVTGRLWTSAASGGTFTGVFDQFFQFGLEFTTGSVGYIDELSYWTDSLAASHQPTGLRLWRVEDATILATVTPIPAPTVTGWQRFTLADTPAIDNLHTYMVCVWTDSTHGTYNGPTTLPTPDTPLHFTSNTNRFSTASGNLPTGTTTSGHIFADARYNEVGIGTTTGSTSPATTTDVTTSVASLGGSFPDWLSRSLNTKGADSAPIDTNNKITTLKGEAEGVNGFAAIKAVADAIASAVGGVAGTLATLAATVSGQITALGASLGADIATVETHLIDALTGTGGLADELAAHRAATEPEGETLPGFIEAENATLLNAINAQTNAILTLLAHGGGIDAVATIVGESDWGNIFRFDVPADFYTVDITATDIEAIREDVGGTSVWDHLGFCIPLTLEGLPEYGPRLAMGGQVIRTGRQMGGIILNGRRVLSGHVTAYQYQAP